MEIIVKEIPAEDGQSKPESSVVETLPTTWELTDSQMADLANFLDTRFYELDIKDKERLKYIFNAVKEGKGDFDEVMSELRKVRVKIGSPTFNERSIDKFHRYFKLLNQFNSLDMAIKAEERGQ